MEISIKAFVAQEHNNFENFTPPLAARFEEGITRSIAEVMRRQLKRNGSAELALPWGIFRAEFVTKGEAGNVTPTWEPSKAFLKCLNTPNMDPAERSETINQDSFDEEYMKLFKDWVGYGMFDPEAPENKAKADQNKGVKLTDNEAEYFLNEYALVLIGIGREKQMDGKIFSLEINNGFPHGKYNFEYDDDDIKVTFTPDKVFKQILKDDESQYAFVVAVAKHARRIADETEEAGEILSEKPVRLAVEDFAAGKVKSADYCKIDD